MSPEPFLQPHLTGARFEAASIPLEFLRDLAALENLVVEVAKAEFLKDHPERRRSQRGFTQGLALKLTGITDGSAVPTIELVPVVPALFPPSNQIYFERARDAIAQAIWAADHGLSILDWVSEKALAYFDKIGRSLRDGEAMEFSRGSGDEPARLTRDTRRKLLLASSGLREMTDEAVVRGTIPEVDQHDMTFEIQLVDGRKVKAPLAASYLDTVLEAFNGYKSETRVFLQGIARLSRSDRLLGFESIEQAGILDPLDISYRLEEIGQLRNGWLNGDGTVPSTDELNWLSRAFDEHYPDNLALPYLYPTPTGGIQAEWSLPPVEATLDINPAQHSGVWHALNLESGEENESEFDLGTRDGWVRLIEAVKEIGGVI